MKLSLSDAGRNAMVEVIARLIDSGGKPGRIELSTSTGALLSVLKFSYPCAGDASKGELKFSPIQDDGSARGSGLAEVAHIIDADGGLVFECDVTDAKGDGVIKLNSNEIRAGGPVRIESFRLGTGK